MLMVHRLNGVSVSATLPPITCFCTMCPQREGPIDTLHTCLLQHALLCLHTPTLHLADCDRPGICIKASWDWGGGANGMSRFLHNVALTRKIICVGCFNSNKEIHHKNVLNLGKQDLQLHQKPSRFSRLMSQMLENVSAIILMICANYIFHLPRYLNSVHRQLRR